MTREQTVRCKVRPGVFSGEYVVSLTSVKGRETERLEFVSDRDSVDLNREPSDGIAVDGRVRVWSLGSLQGLVRILIPGSGGSDSKIVTVPAEVVAD